MISIWRQRIFRPVGSGLVGSGLVGLVALACWWWASPSFDVWALDDGTAHLLRAYTFDDLLHRGVWFPGWVPDLYFGYGHPLFNYIPPSPYYLVSLGHFLGLDLYGGLQAVGIAAVLAGVVGAFILGHSLWHSRAIGFLAAAAYGLSPYPFLYNLYIRGNVPEALALGLLPWLFWAAWRIWREPSCSRVLLLALLIATIILTHNVSALLGVGLLLVWTLCLFLREKTLLALGATFLAIAGGVALGAYFWLPALGERDLVHIEYVHKVVPDYRVWLIDPLGITLSDRWPDYTGTRVGPIDLRWTPALTPSGSGPQKLNLLQLGLVAITTIGLVVSVRRKAHPDTATLLFSAVMIGSCLFMMSSWSADVWPKVPLLRNLQFPWRLHGPLALVLAMGAAGGVRQLWSSDGRGQLLVATGMTMLIVSTAGRGLPTIDWPLMDNYGRRLGSEQLRATEVGKYDDATASSGEYMPRAVQYERWGPTPTIRGKRLYEALVPEHSWLGGWVRPLTGRLQITSISVRSNATTVEVKADTSAVLAWRTIDFPGWQVYLDGQPTSHDTVPYASKHKASLGFIVVDVPPGRHRLHLELRPTPFRAVGIGLTLVTVVGILLISLLRLRQDWYSQRVAPGGLACQAIVLLGGAGLVLVLGGRALNYAAGPDELEAPAENRIVVDFASAVEDGSAVLTSPAGPILGSYIQLRWLRVVDQERGQHLLMPRDWRWWTIIHRERRWLYMHPPSSLTVDATIPPGAIFQSGLGLDPDVWHQPDSHGVRFLLEVATPGGWRTLFHRHVAPRQRVADRRWVDEVVDLGALAGQRVTLRLRTASAATLSYAWGGWAEPMILVRDTARYD